MSGLQQGLFTNALEKIPFEELFKWIRISLTDQGFDPIQKPEVPFGICLNHTAGHDEDELRIACRYAKMFGAKYFQVRPALVGNYLDQPDLKAPDFLKEYEDQNFKVYVTEYKYEEATRAKTYDKCYGYHFCPSIDWEGNVSVCMYLTNEHGYRLGSLKEKPLSEILHSVPIHASVCEDCQNCCKNHEINKILFSAKKTRDVNFI
jgi:hypothetical protein